MTDYIIQVQHIVKYLESVHKGELRGGSFEDIQTQCQDAQKNNPEYKDPVLP